MTKTDTDQRRIALTTGASAGIGRDIVRMFAAHGFDMVLLAWREDRLQALMARHQRNGYPRAA